MKEAGQIDEALELAEWGLTLKAEEDRPYGIVGLARWLRDCAAALARREPALTAAGAAFEHSLSLDDFRAAESLGVVADMDDLVENITILIERARASVSSRGRANLPDARL